MVYVSTAIAVLSLAASGVALYYSALQRARPVSVLGTTVKVYYPSDGGFGVYLPVTFVNDSPLTGTVRRCALTLYAKARPDERFFMDWRFFMKLTQLDSSGDHLGYDKVSSAETVGIPGHASAERLIWFSWRSSQEPELRLLQGDYELVLHYWVGANQHPVADVHSFTVTPAIQEDLDGLRQAHDSGVVDILLDNNLPFNMLMGAEQATQLLGA